MAHTASSGKSALETRSLAALGNAQQSLIDALADGDPSGSASALAELRFALQQRTLDDQRATQAILAIDALGDTLRHCHGIHERPRIAA